MQKTKHPGGRPTIYTPELARLICEKVATHTCSLSEICQKFDEFPTKQTVNEWRFRYKEFSAMYAVAKLHQAELMAEEIDELSREKYYYTDAEGNSRVDGGFIQSQRLQVDTRKWMASKLLPRTYVEKTVIENKSDNEETERLKNELRELREQLLKNNTKEY